MSTTCTTQDRFWSKVAPGDGGCLLWLGAKNQKGYGRFLKNGRNCRAHRVAYEMTLGDIPAHLVVMHKCDTPSCVNPEHLMVGTVIENNADMRAKKRDRQVVRAGEMNGLSKLTNEIVAAIRADRSMSSYALALVYGVSPEAIQQARRGQTWKCVQNVSVSA